MNRSKTTNSIFVIDKFSKKMDGTSIPFNFNYTIEFLQNNESLMKNSLQNGDLVCLVLYDAFDLIEVLPLYNRNFSLVIATAENTLLEKLNCLEYAYLINLSTNPEKIIDEITEIIYTITVEV
jgi:hypothetical protein